MNYIKDYIMKDCVLILVIFVCNPGGLFPQSLNFSITLSGDSVPNCAFGLSKLDINILNQQPASYSYLGVKFIAMQVMLPNQDWIDLPIPECAIRYTDIDDRYVFRVDSVYSSTFYLNLFNLYLQDSTSRVNFLPSGGNISYRTIFNLSSQDGSISSVCYSSPKLITMPGASAQDLAAFNYLFMQKDSFPGILFFTSTSDASTGEYLSLYNYIIDNFPNSCLAQIAQYRSALLICLRYGADLNAYPSVKNNLLNIHTTLSNSNVQFIRDKSNDIFSCINNK